MAEVSIHSLVPDAQALLALSPEELAGVVLQYLNSLSSNSGQLNRYMSSGTCWSHVMIRHPGVHK